jgi:hypothetical protein
MAGLTEYIQHTLNTRGDINESKHVYILKNLSLIVSLF